MPQPVRRHLFVSMCPLLIPPFPIESTTFRRQLHKWLFKHMHFSSLSIKLPAKARGIVIDTISCIVRRQRAKSCANTKLQGMLSIITTEQYTRKCSLSQHIREELIVNYSLPMTSLHGLVAIMTMHMHLTMCDAISTVWYTFNTNKVTSAKP